MSTNERILFRKTKEINERIAICYRLLENVISSKSEDTVIYSLIISEICNGKISDEAIFINLSENKALAIRIFDELSENLVFPYCASEVLDEIFERLL